mgnify:CR=1 FL=1
MANASALTMAVVRGAVSIHGGGGCWSTWFGPKQLWLTLKSARTDVQQCAYLPGL